MSDLKYRSLPELKQDKRDCERYMQNLSRKLNGQQTRMEWIDHYIEKREKEMSGLTLNTVESIISLCTYKEGWDILAKQDPKGMYIQLRNNEGVCAVSGEPSPWVSGKRYLSQWMCKQEVVGVVFDLIKSAEMHEVHECFRYKGRSIYNPHLSPDALADLASKKDNFVFREDSMTKA